MNLPYPGMRGPGYSHGSMSIEAAIRGAGVARDFMSLLRLRPAECIIFSVSRGPAPAQLPTR
ncbi:hypothetical protein GGE45_003959 [Rhizobium aethiopicum]|nr:hypothetical protein [Rhizobium aethiopicum]